MLHPTSLISSSTNSIASLLNSTVHLAGLLRMEKQGKGSKNGAYIYKNQKTPNLINQ